MKYIYTFLFIILYQFSFAQSDTILPKGIIKYSPMSLFNVLSPAIQVAYEKRLKGNKTLQFEIGYLGDFWNVEEWGGLYDFSGYRLKVERRNYFYYDGFARGGYIGGMIVFKQTFDEKSDGWFSVYDRAFFQILPYRRMTSNLGFYCTVGKQYFLSENVVFEIGLAAGIRFLHSYYLGLPDLVDNSFTIYNGSRNDLSIFPSLYPTLKFGYAF